MTSQRILVNVRVVELRAELAKASPATRLVITDVHPDPSMEGTYRFDIDVEEIVSHSAFDRHCGNCGISFVAESPKAQFCTGRCRVAAHRKAQKEASEALIAAAAETAPS